VRNLQSSQIKGLSEFLNTVAAAWFSAGVISPFFVSTENQPLVVLIAGAQITLSLFFLSVSLSLLRNVKL